MAFFITEKETEAWLQLETRVLPMPDGTKKPFTDFRLTWRSYDYLTVVCRTYTGERLVELAQQTADHMGYSFEDAFPEVLTYLHRKLRKAQGLD